eukprot:COSAG02_NODE_4212_length_5624_cov_12.618281_3_plen_174_part_00
MCRESTCSICKNQAVRVYARRCASVRVMLGNLVTPLQNCQYWNRFGDIWCASARSTATTICAIEFVLTEGVYDTGSSQTKTHLAQPHEHFRRSAIYETIRHLASTLYHLTCDRMTPPSLCRLSTRSRSWRREQMSRTGKVTRSQRSSLHAATETVRQTARIVCRLTALALSVD